MMHCNTSIQHLREYQKSIADIRGEPVSANLRLIPYGEFAASTANIPPAFAEEYEFPVGEAKDACVFFAVQQGKSSMAIPDEQPEAGERAGR